MKLSIKKQLFLVFILISSTTAFAQKTKITGQIVDETSKETIPYAVITCRLVTDSTILSSCVSDTTGNFILKKIPKNNYFLSITHLGYQTQNVQYQKVTSNVPLKIYLHSKHQNLTEITVNEKLTTSKQSLSRLDFFVTKETLNGAQLATDVIANAPGITVDFNNNVSLNGSQKILFLKNGVELPTADMVNQISPESIQKIEIISNPGSRYSNQDYSAIINIKTKQSKNQLFSASTFLKSSPKNNFYDVLTNLSYSKNKHDVFFTHKYYFRDYKQTLVSSYFSTKIQLDTVFSVVQKPRKENDNEFFYGYNFLASSTARFGILGYSSFYQENPNSQLQFTNRPQAKYSYKNEDFETNDIRTYYLNEKDSSTIDLKAYHTWKNLYNNLELFQTQTKIHQATKKRVAGIEANIITVAPNFEYKYGLMYSYINESSSDKESETLTQFGYRENRYSAFLNLSKDYKHRGIQFGGNFYYYKRNMKNKEEDIEKFLFLPDFAYFEKLDKHNSLKLSVTTTVRNPSLWEMNPLINSEDPLQEQFGTPSLKAETNHDFSLSYTFSKKHTYLSTKLYYTVHRNNITPFYQLRNKVYQNQYKNLSRFSSSGILSNFNFSIAKWWKIRSFCDVFQNKISSNSSLNKNSKWSFIGNFTSIWILSPKIIAGFIYNYTSSQLSYNREYDDSDLNMMVLNYSLSKKVQLSCMVLQPFNSYKSKTKYADDYLTYNASKKIDIQTFLITLKFNILNKKTNTSYELYENSDAKHP